MRLRRFLSVVLIALAPLPLMLPLPACGPAPTPCASDAECNEARQGWICRGTCQPPPCTTDADCAPGEQCGPHERCEFRRCEPDGCPAGSYCFGISCSAECAVDADCQPRGYCFVGNCHPKDCDTSAECAPGEFCSDFKRCSPGCRTDVECSAGEFCDRGSCSTRLCSSDADCGGDSFCDSRGLCIGECRVDADCPAGSICDDRQLCRGGCRSDASCPAGTTCQSGRCQGTCRSSIECAGDERCTLLGVCAPRTCATSDDCPDGLACDPVFGCGLPECRMDIQCASSETCVNGSCVRRQEPCGSIAGACTPGVCSGGAACVAAKQGCRCVDYSIFSFFLLFTEDSDQAGKSSGQTMTLQTAVDDLETHEVSLRYPDEFAFNGFALQGQKAAIGAVEFDVNADAKPELSVPLLPIDSTTAFADTIRDGSFNAAFEPVIRYQPGSHILTARLPLGGDANPQTILTPVATQVTIRLAAGVFSNPERAGHYVVKTEALSVDPDTDGTSDRKGEPPQRASADLPIRIHGRAIALDIRPGAFPNALNPDSNGLIAVAILTTKEFDAGKVDAASVEFGPGRAREVHGRAHREDVDGDGDLDLLLHFRVEAAALSCGDTSAFLSAFTTAGEAIEGTDSLVTVGCGGKKR